MKRTDSRLWSSPLLLLILLLLPAYAGAQFCQLSINDSGSVLTVGSSSTIRTELSNPPPSDTRTVGVRFEILQGEADFAGSSSPLVVPVQLSGGNSPVVIAQAELVGRAPGDVHVRVTWLNSTSPSAEPLVCDSSGMPVSPNGFDRFFTVQGPPPPVLGLVLVSGAGQQVSEGAQSAPLVVAVTGDDCTCTTGVPVLFEVEPPGALQLSGNRVISDGQGRAQVTARGQVVGSAVVRARLENAPQVAPVDIPIAVTSRLLGAQLLLVAGSGQQLAVEAVSAPLQVGARDAAGQPLGNAAVSWRVEPAGSASLDAASSSTDGQGNAQNRVRPLRAGSFEVVAVLEGTDATVRFSLSAGAVPAGSALSIISGNAQNLVPGIPSAPLVVELRGPQAQALPGVRLRFSTDPEIGGVLSPPEVVTGSDGRASTQVIAQLPIGVGVIAAVADEPGISVRFNVRGGTAFIDNLTSGQREVATAIDNACPALFGMVNTLGGAQRDLLDRCSEIVGAAGSQPGNVRAVLDQLLPDEAAPQAVASLTVRDAQLRNLDVRLDALRSGARPNALAGLNLQTANGVLPLDLFSQLVQDDPAGGGLISPWGMFLTGTIGRVDRSSSVNNPGFDGDTLSLTGGIDYRFSSRFVAGLALGYDDNELQLLADSGRVDTRSLTVSLYGSYAADNDFYVDGRIAVGRLDFDLQRNIRYNLGNAPVNVAALADPEGDSRLFALTLGRNFSRNAWNFGGYLRGELSSIDLDGYAERIQQSSGAGIGLAVAVDSRKLESRTATLGARLSFASSRDWGVLLPFARVEWVHEFEDEAQVVMARFVNDPTATPIRFAGDTPDDGYGNVALGLSSVLANGRSLFVQYERRFAQDFIDRDTLSIGGRFEF